MWEKHSLKAPCPGVFLTDSPIWLVLFGRQSAAGGVVDTPAGPILTGAINKIRQAHPEIGEQW
jgi:hypothetical protein